MRKTMLALGVMTFILGITLICLASVPFSSQWENFDILDKPKSELIVNKNFEVAQDSTVTYQIHLEKSDNITINAAISEPGTNRKVGANIDFALKDGAQIYQSYYGTSNVSLSWTAPKSGNYSLSFDNSKYSDSKEGIVMVMKYWRATETYVRLVSKPLINPSFVLFGAAACVGGAIVVILELRRKTSGIASNEDLPTATPDLT